MSAGVELDGGELADLLEFAAEFLAGDDERLRLAYRRWTAGAASPYPLAELVGDLTSAAWRLRQHTMVPR